MNHCLDCIMSSYKPSCNQIPESSCKITTHHGSRQEHAWLTSFDCLQFRLPWKKPGYHSRGAALTGAGQSQPRRGWNGYCFLSSHGQFFHPEHPSESPIPWQTRQAPPGTKRRAHPFPAIGPLFPCPGRSWKRRRPPRIMARAHGPRPGRTS
jgi:hypothetical protein